MKSTKYAPHYYETKLPVLIRQQRAQRLSSGAVRKKSVPDELVIRGQMNEFRPLAFGMLRMPANPCLNRDTQEMSIINKSHAIALFEATELLATSMLDRALSKTENNWYSNQSDSNNVLFGPWRGEIYREFPKFFAASYLAEHIGKSPVRIDMSLNELYAQLVEIYSELGIDSTFLDAGLNKDAETLSTLKHGIGQALDLVAGYKEKVIRLAEIHTISKFIIKNGHPSLSFRMEDHYWGLRIAQAYMDDEKRFSEICSLVKEIDKDLYDFFLKGECVREYLAKIASEYKKELLMSEMEV